MREALERDPPYGAQVSFEGVRDRRLERPGVRAVARGVDHAAPHAPSTGARRCTSAAAARFRSWACSGSSFPKTQFFITGVLGPHANAHGPNEFLHLDYAKKLTACVSLVLADARAHARA